MRTTARFVILLTFAASIAGCKKEEAIRVYSAPKDPPPTTAPVVRAENIGAPEGSQAAGAPLRWTAPAEWKSLPAGEMRFATYLVNENPPVQMTVIPLPMEAGELLPNVNRWEKQLGLPPSPAEKLDSIVKSRTVSGLDVKSVDLTGPESAAGNAKANGAANGGGRQRMLAAMVPAGGRVWFFKLSGPVDVVGREKDHFDGLIASLKPAGEESGSGSAKPQAVNGAMSEISAPASSGSMKLSRFAAGNGWEEIPGAKAPRMVAFDIGPEDAKAELVVTRFNQHSTGSFLDNINRWRGQLGLTPVADVNGVSMTPATVGKAEQAMLITIDAPQSTPAKRMLVVISSIGPDMWFFKLTGPAATLDAQKPAFDAFLKSMEFAPDGDAVDVKP